MATYSRRVLHIERVEFHVPAPAPWGATFAEVVKAIHTASAEFRDHRGLASTVVLNDDEIAVAPQDDAIVVSYEVRTTTEAS